MMRGRPILRLRGFTLIELMIVIALVGLIVALAAPSLREMIQVQRLRSVHGQLGTDLQFAKSEAIRMRVPVHVRVQPATGTAPACYILYSDTVVNPPHSTACDCQATPKCAASTTQEIKTVSIDSWTGLDMATINYASMAFDPATGAMLLFPDDTGTFVPREFIVDVQLTTEYRGRSVVGFSGRVRNCSPAGTRLALVAC